MGSTEMISFAVGGDVPLVVGSEWGDAHQFRQMVDVEECHVHGIRKCVRPRSETAMAKFSDVESGFHGYAWEPIGASTRSSTASSTLTPSERATRSAEFTPSSWKP